MEPRLQLVPCGAHEVHVAEWGESGREAVVPCGTASPASAATRRLRARALARDYRVLCPDTPLRPQDKYCFASYARLTLRQC